MLHKYRGRTAGDEEDGALSQRSAGRSTLLPSRPWVGSPQRRLTTWLALLGAIVAVLVVPSAASAQVPPTESAPAPAAADGPPTKAWAAPDDRDDLEDPTGAPVPDEVPALVPEEAAPVELPPELAAASTPPRRFPLAAVSSSRSVSAPPSDPMSMMERDAGLSVKLSDGHQLWLFADSALVIGTNWDYFSGHGTGAISVGSDPYTLTEPSVPVGPNRHPASVLITGDSFTCPAGYSKFAWPSSAVAVPTSGDGDIVYIYYQSICGIDGDAGSYFNVAMGIARYDYDPARPPSPTTPIRAMAINSSLFPPMPGHSGPGGAGYGVTSVLVGSTVYAYACYYSPVWQSCRVARVSTASIALASAYRFWNGTDWVANMASAVDMDVPWALIGVKGSVSYVPALGLYVMADNDFPSAAVAVRWAKQPQGPWTTPVKIDLPGCAGPECWAAEVHGSLSTSSRLAITYYDSETRPGMRAISVPIVHEPTGDIENIGSSAPNQIVVWGRAVDPDVVDPVTVHVYVDGTFVDELVADQPRPDLQEAFPGQIGGGYVVGVDVLPGRHTVCIYGINVGPGSSNPNIGCRTVDVAAPAYGPVSATNDDGRLELFAMDGLGGLTHAWQLTPGGAWSGWESIGLDPRSAPAIARNGDGRLEIFAVDRNGWLVHRWQIIGQGWSPWVSMGVAATGTPAVGTNVDGRLELFVRRSDGRLLHAWQSPPTGWSAFVDSGASASAAPEINASADGRLEIFVTSGDGGLLHSWQTRINGPFSAWQYTGTLARGAPDSQRSVDGRLELFATNRDGYLVHQWQIVKNGAWSGWAPLGYLSSNPPIATRNTDGRLEVFVLAGDTGIWHAWQDPRAGNGWSGWAPMGLGAYTEPTAAANKDGRLALFALAGWGQLLQSTQVPGQGWSAWRPVTPGQP